jgi:hypothetical protein
MADDRFSAAFGEAPLSERFGQLPEPLEAEEEPISSVPTGGSYMGFETYGELASSSQQRSGCPR